MNLQEMLARQQEIVDAAKEEGRTLSSEEQREFDRLQGRIEKEKRPREMRAKPNRRKDKKSEAKTEALTRKSRERRIS